MNEARAVRPEIQALRALAVVAVVVYHLFPARLSGGFVGVDVFFVVSGYLISSHLLREAGSTGGVSVLRFWARRIRRLLPASLLVALVALVAVVILVPQPLWQQFASEIAAASLYVENWQLAANAVDYLAQDNAASPVQHYWSLSVEEQFYLIWPILVLLAARFIGRGDARRTRNALGTAFALIVALSAAWSVIQTIIDPGTAYFSTLTRAWEFGAGGLLAVWVPGRLRAPRGARATMSWLGLAAIVAACLVYDGTTPFPSLTAALPVAGALLVMAAGDVSGWWGTGWLARLRPIQYLGDISYSIYLWHWMLIVLAGYALDHDLHLRDRIAIVAITLVLAALTKHFVEDPVRRGAWLSQRTRPRATFALMLCGVLIVVGAAAWPWTTVQVAVAQDDARVNALVAEPPPCYGAAAVLDPSCVDVSAPTSVEPLPIRVSGKGGYGDYLACASPVEGVPADLEPDACSLGADPGSASQTVVLLGDSHAMRARGLISQVVAQQHWRVISFAKAGCPASLAKKLLSGSATKECIDHNREVVAWLSQHPEIHTAVVTGLSSDNPDYVEHAADVSGQDAMVQGYLDYWAAVPTLDRIIVLRDDPHMKKDVLECVDDALRSAKSPAAECARKQKYALKFDAAAAAAQRIDYGTVIDMTDAYCPDGVCPPVIGGVLVYTDWNHYSLLWQLSLAPFIAERLAAAG